jgi:hypothetical protein
VVQSLRPQALRDREETGWRRDECGTVYMLCTSNPTLSGHWQQAEANFRNSKALALRRAVSMSELIPVFSNLDEKPISKVRSRRQAVLSEGGFPSTSPLVSFCTSVFSSYIYRFDSFTIQPVCIKTSTFHHVPTACCHILGLPVRASL